MLSNGNLPACYLMAQGEASNGLGPLVMILATFALFYFMLLRPERKRRAETADMLAKLKKNDRVVTIGGIHGTVVNLLQNGTEVVIKVDESNNTKLRVLRSAIQRVADEESAKNQDNA